MSCQKYNEKEQLTDLLCAEKFMTSKYNDCLNESSTPELRAAFGSILEDEHKMQNEIFKEMNTRGFYPLKSADEATFKQVKDKFACHCGCQG